MVGNIKSEVLDSELDCVLIVMWIKICAFEGLVIKTLIFLCYVVE